MSKDKVDELQAPPGEKWVQEGETYVIKKEGSLLVATKEDLMEKPKCGCFDVVLPGHGESVGEAKVLSIGAEICDVFADMMQHYGMCAESFDYAMVTTISLLMKQVAAQKGKGDRRAENEEFHRKCEWIADAVRKRGDEMHAAALNMMMAETPQGGIN